MTSDTYQEPVTSTLTEAQLAEIDATVAPTAGCTSGAINCVNITVFNNLVNYCVAQHQYNVAPPFTDAECNFMGIYG
ncbi:MAG: hypothetical protein LBS90_06290 [Oscillospiraceae bacterium]|jgi:hypothetical protein|nr:hypothetical protein [Oscillospiraceae bacterium]